jgi:hypothetical protein
MWNSYKGRLQITKLWARQGHAVTLTFNVATQMLCLTHGLNMVTNAGKRLNLFQSTENLQHFEISFDGKFNIKKWYLAMVLRNGFKMPTCCHGNRKFKIEYAITKLWSVNICAKFVQYWSLLNSFIALWTCKSHFNENSHFSQNAHEVMGEKKKRKPQSLKGLNWGILTWEN